jgi:hypothetical protein
MKVLFGNKDLVIWMHAPDIQESDANGSWEDQRRYRFRQDNSQFIDIGEVSVSYNTTNGNTVKHIYGYKPKIQLNLVCYHDFNSDDFNDNIVNFLAGYLNNIKNGRWVAIRPTPDASQSFQYSFYMFLENIRVYNIIDNTKLVGQRLTATATSRDMISKDEFKYVFYEDTDNGFIYKVPDLTGASAGVAIS